MHEIKVGFSVFRNIRNLFYTLFYIFAQFIYSCLFKYSSFIKKARILKVLPNKNLTWCYVHYYLHITVRAL